MDQEQKGLLLQELGTRLQYDVKLSYRCNHVHILKGIHKSGLIIINDIVTNVITTTDVENITPYLLPFSSMTEEQNLEYLSTCKGGNAYCPTFKSFDWLNKNHFDYRGLILKGLAIDATGLNIY